MGGKNADLALLRRFVAEGGPLAVDSNALARALGAELVGHDQARREISMRYRPGESFLQGAGKVQGGAVATMLDFAMAFAAFTVLPEGSTVATTTLNASFMGTAGTAGTAGATEAGAIEATGRVDKAGRRVVFASAELRWDGRMVATATSSLLVLPEG